MNRLDYNEMFRAFTTSDANYDGKFYVAVKSTKIYCLPSCTAKQPLEKNILFFATRDEAISSGFRGCLRCKSEFYPDIFPVWLKDIQKYLDQNKSKKINENQLMRLTNMEISTIRRYFKHYFQMTPLSYHRKLRLNYAKDLISKGVNHLNAAYESGFESVSGFRDAFYKEFSKTPGEVNGNK